MLSPLLRFEHPPPEEDGRELTQKRALNEHDRDSVDCTPDESGQVLSLRRVLPWWSYRREKR